MSNQENARGITCQELANQATLLLENRLSATSTITIWRHLESCFACRTYITQLILVRDSLQKLPGSTMSDQMRKHLLQRLARMAGEGDNSEQN